MAEALRLRHGSIISLHRTQVDWATETRDQMAVDSFVGDLMIQDVSTCAGAGALAAATAVSCPGHSDASSWPLDAVSSDVIAAASAAALAASAAWRGALAAARSIGRLQEAQPSDDEDGADRGGSSGSPNEMELGDLASRRPRLWRSQPPTKRRKLRSITALSWVRPRHFLNICISCKLLCVI